MVNQACCSSLVSALFLLQTIVVVFPDAMCVVANNYTSNFLSERFHMFMEISLQGVKYTLCPY